jgi:hypothetical protein
MAIGVDTDLAEILPHPRLHEATCAGFDRLTCAAAAHRTSRRTGKTIRGDSTLTLQ